MSGDMDFERDADVVVAGAGVAGIAAALECARSGLSTTLVERSILPGGLATGGLIYVYLPLCDGNGRQVTFGIAEELLHLSLRYGPGDVPAGWRHARDADETRRYRTVFSPASFVLALDEVLEAAGVELLFDTLVCATRTEGDRVTALEVENKSGRGVLAAKCFVDATGDADVAHRAGAQTVTAQNWLSMWALVASLDRAREAVDAASGGPLLDMLILGAFNDGTDAPGGSGKFDGTDADDVTRFVLESRRLLRDYYRRKHAGGTDRRDHFPVTIPTMPQLRTTRRIVGRTTLTDGQDGQRFDDSIGLVADWRKPGFVWEVPYGTLVPTGVRGLLTAGRCISSSGDAWEVTRVIPAAALTGQSAGAAAALAVENHTTPDALDAADVQTRLSARGVRLHLDELDA
ncbi:MAG TPA: FAD-dependent oxidoreductase [Planctomycetota bacterium]|nr:FAD-dependent oxidoreductase [Planctomycetota bacterium]